MGDVLAASILCHALCIVPSSRVRILTHPPLAFRQHPSQCFQRPQAHKRPAPSFCVSFTAARLAPVPQPPPPPRLSPSQAPEAAVDAARAKLESLAKHGVRPPQCAYHALLRACSHCHLPECSRALLLQLQRAGGRPDAQVRALPKAPRAYDAAGHRVALALAAADGR